jgi:hypothetical protein
VTFDKSEYNRRYYEANREREKARKLAHYHAGYKDQIDREKRRAYMQEYYRTHPRRPLTDEEKAERSRRRREKYATDAEHREKAKAQARDWGARNPEKKKAQRLQLAFGLEMEQFQAMLSQQDNACAICGYTDTVNPKLFPVVDHDHKTGKIRGLLCMSCNQGLGKFKDDPALLEKAIVYLISNGSSGAISTTSSEPASERLAS